MATKNLSDYDISKVPDASNMKFAIVTAEWNFEVTSKLLEGVINSLTKHGVTSKNISSSFVPGTFELTYGAKLYAEGGNFDAIVVLGCVIQGETRHFDFICQSVTQGITELNLHHNIPVIFGVLTTENQQQAEDRAGGKHGNKGDEAAISAIKMVAFRKDKKFGANTISGFAGFTK